MLYIKYTYINLISFKQLHFKLIKQVINLSCFHFFFFCISKMCSTGYAWISMPSAFQLILHQLATHVLAAILVFSHLLTLLPQWLRLYEFCYSRSTGHVLVWDYHWLVSGFLCLQHVLTTISEKYTLLRIIFWFLYFQLETKHLK